MLHEVFYWVLSMSVTAAITGSIVWLIRTIRPIPRRVAVFLWLIPFVRMVMPFGMNSPYSIMSLLSRVATKTVTVYQPTEQVTVSMTNCVTMADSYFPITYKVDVLETVFTVAAVIWLVGAAVLLVLLTVVYIATMREVKAATPLEENIYRCDSCRSPAVYGVFKPKILLPASLKEADREIILLHERTHIRRRDNLWRVLAIIIVAVHWFNPFCWLFLKQFLADTEMACDEQVLASLGEERKGEYARQLLNSAVRQVPMTSAFGGASLKARIRRIVSYKKLTWLSVIASAALLAVSAAVLLTNAG